MPAREGSLEAPKREPIAWEDDAYYDAGKLNAELERVFDICHGCRRCVSLCESFPTLFDLVDESPTMEVDGVEKADYGKVVDQCFMCDLCAETKCPYLPPHEWAVDFPHLMLRAKAVKFRAGDTKWRDRLLTATDVTLKALSIPGISHLADAGAGSPLLRKGMERLAGIHQDAPLPKFSAPNAKSSITTRPHSETTATAKTSGKVAIYTTCYGNHNEPQVVADLVAVFEHNGIAVKLLQDDACCGMPKFELGDLQAVAKLKARNVPVLFEAAEDGWDIIAPVPSCALMYRQELPLMFPDDDQVAAVAAAIRDPFEYLIDRQKNGLLNTDFKQGLGKVSYHAACHQRVQAIGQRTFELLKSIPDTEVKMIERCSGHDGTYAVKAETYDHAMKIARPVVRQTREYEPDHFGSDCPMAGRLIEHGLEGTEQAKHPITMLRLAYGI